MRPPPTPHMDRAHGWLCIALGLEGLTVGGVLFLLPSWWGVALSCGILLGTVAEHLYLRAVLKDAEALARTRMEWTE